MNITIPKLQVMENFNTSVYTYMISILETVHCMNKM
jgi:hypothetical protein